MKPRVIFSQCLLGVPCRYDGKCAAKEPVREIACREGWIPACPEILGGLSTPRSPAERVGDKVMNQAGQDVTENFHRGAQQALNIARMYGAKYALLKEKSPSCGCGLIYDGTFTGNKVSGDGVTAELFKQNNIQVFGESRLGELMNQLRWDDEHDSI